MSTFTNKFDSIKQDWETPDNLYLPLHKRYHFNFDLAASPTNTKCDNFYTTSDSALTKIWKGNCWLNPPYGNTKNNKLSDWVKHAYHNNLKFSCSVTMLIPARTNTSWWHQYCMKATEIIFIEGRPIFKGCTYGLPQPLVIVNFNSTSSMHPFTSYLSLNLKTGIIK